MDVETDEDNHFTDNARHTVDFAPVSGVILATPGVEFNLTDTTKQFVLNVSAEKQRTLKVRYSEAVAWDTDSSVEIYDANNPANYIINGDPLTTTDETDFTLSADRKTVTINLTIEDALRAGDDNLEVKNVGDWAGVTDVRNRISTQRIEYPLNIDTSIPGVTIERHSPEQFLIKLDKDVTFVDNTKSLEELIAIFYGEDADEDDIRDIQFDTDGSPVNGTQGITFTAMDDGVVVGTPATTPFNQILLELEDDWTNEDGTGSPMAAHWVDANPLQFIIAEKSFKSTLGNRNVDINIEVANGRDRTSPKAIDFVQDKDVNDEWLETATVTMDEPVQLVGLTQPNTTANADQVADNGDVQAGEINFEKDGKVVTGIFNSVEIDDFKFEIQPNGGFAALRAEFTDPADASGEWIVSITGISDDYGNTMATQEYKYYVPEIPGSTPGVLMEVEPEVMYAQYFNNNDYSLAGNGFDVITVKFTEVMSNSGANAVGDTSNYVLDGTTLADLGSSVRKGIAGVTEDHIGEDANFVLTVASNLKSADGQVLVGENELNLVDVDLTTSGDDESYYTAGILVENYEFVLVGGTVTDGDADEKLDTVTQDKIKVDFDGGLFSQHIIQVAVNGKVISLANVTINSKDISIDMEDADIRYEDGDRIEVKVNGQTVYVEVK